MKITVIILFSTCLFLIIIGCNNTKKADKYQMDFEKSQYITSKQNKDVILSIKENRITSDIEEITLIYTNQSETEYFYGGIDYLEIYIDGIWYSIPTKNNTQWHMLAYKLPPNCQVESCFSIKTYYGSIDSGKYRIIKTLGKLDDPIDKTYIIAEFNIE